MIVRPAAAITAAGAGVAGLWALLAQGKLTVDLGLGRTSRPLGPLTAEIRAPRELVYDVVAAPYLGRTARALESKLHVIERGDDMVLAAHFTKLGRLVATTVETVRFEPPAAIHFRLVRGPVPHVVEQFLLEETPTGTVLRYHGELAADLWALGRWWGDGVARRWEAVVAATLQSVKAEAERRAADRRPA
jgi:Polyketide cyclase / dehydrase and lipid transport